MVGILGIYRETITSCSGMICLNIEYHTYHNLSCVPSQDYLGAADQMFEPPPNPECVLKELIFRYSGNLIKIL
jgi:hypothetical protein